MTMMQTADDIALERVEAALQRRREYSDRWVDGWSDTRFACPYCDHGILWNQQCPRCGWRPPGHKSRVNHR